MRIFLSFTRFLILSFFTCLFALSCLKYDPNIELIQNIIPTTLTIGKDILISNNTNGINLIEPKIYKENGTYYFGNFYYADEDNIYYFDAPRSNLNVSIGDEKRTILSDYANINNARIMDIDDNSLYITHLSRLYLESIVTNEFIITDSPDIEEGYGDSVITNITTSTNYSFADATSLSRISKEGQILFTLQNILDEDATILKIISTDNNFYIVYRKNVILLDRYTKEGNYIDTYILETLEQSDESNKQYTRIIDVLYLRENKKIAIMTESILSGKVIEREIFSTDNFNNFEKDYTIDNINDRQVLVLTNDGVLISLLFQNNQYLVSKYDIFTKRQSDFNINMKNIADIRSFDVFKNNVVSFNLLDDVITFYKY